MTDAERQRVTDVYRWLINLENSDHLHGSLDAQLLIHELGARAEAAEQQLQALQRRVGYLESIARTIDADVKRGEPCPICSQAPHAYHCGLVASLTQPGAASREVVMDCEKELNAANATLGSVAQKVQDWLDAELRMRVLHGGLPGSGYDKLADGYGTCADELRAVLEAEGGA